MKPILSNGYGYGGWGGGEIPPNPRKLKHANLDSNVENPISGDLNFKTFSVEDAPAPPTGDRAFERSYLEPFSLKFCIRPTAGVLMRRGAKLTWALN